MDKLPQHIAIIMDGNGRWAESNGRSRIEGHRMGAQTAEKIVEACVSRGIKYLTLYTFSEENWIRPKDEVSSLMKLLGEFLETKVRKMIENGVCLKVIGDVYKLPSELRESIARAQNTTVECQKMTLILALSYGSRQEICRAISKIVDKGINEVTPEVVSKYLDTSDIPDPDLLIRTSGEFRISNFLLWQLSYTELYFTDILWPDFNDKELDKAIKEYQMRERRFGAI